MTLQPYCRQSHCQLRLVRLLLAACWLEINQQELSQRACILFLHHCCNTKITQPQPTKSDHGPGQDAARNLRQQYIPLLLLVLTGSTIPNAPPYTTGAANRCSLQDPKRHLIMSYARFTMIFAFPKKANPAPKP